MKNASKFTHTIAGIMATLAGFYAFSDGFRTWIAQLVALYSAHVPHILQPVPALAFALWSWYRNSQSSPSLSKIVHSGQIFLLQCFIPALLVFSLAGCPSFSNDLAKVEKQLPVIESIGETITGLVAPEYLPMVKVIDSSISAAVNELDTILKGANGKFDTLQPSVLKRIEALVQEIQDELPNILPIGHITDPETIRYVNAYIGAVNTVLLELASLMPDTIINTGSTPTLAQSKVRARVVNVKIISVDQLKAQFNSQQSRVRI